MTFLSLDFLLFGGLVFAAFWALPVRFRPFVLLCANVYFALCFGVQALVALFCISALGWAFGLLLDRKKSGAALFLGVALCTLPLLCYKYLAFFAELFGASGRFSVLLAPVGISFYVFKSIGYLVRVYKVQMPAEHNFLHYFNYTGFFVQLTSGPIQPADTLLPQLKQSAANFDRDLAYLGCVRFCFGLFQKKCLADQLFGYQSALTNPEYYYGLGILWSLLAYALQLYFDFAGYSNMAIGLANLLGIETEENFISPYFSHSISEFWRRWHISLSTFLRDNIYFPLGGSRKGTLRLIVATMTTFVVSGAWHGATGGFLVWGALQGIYLLAGRLTAPARNKAWALLRQDKTSLLRRVASCGVTFCLVTFAWLFFYTGNVGNAIALLQQMVAPAPLSVHYIKESIIQLGYTTGVLARLGAMCGFAAIVDWLSREGGFGLWVKRQNKPVLVVFCYVCLFSALFWGAQGALPNIYFAF